MKTDNPLPFSPAASACAAGTVARKSRKLPLE